MKRSKKLRRDRFDDELTKKNFFEMNDFCHGLLAFAGRPARGSVTLPGGKSHAIRAIFLASQAEGISTIGPLPKADDVERALAWVAAGNVKIERAGDFVKITGLGGAPRFGNVTFNAGDSAAVLRFGMFWCAAGEGNATITGSQQLAKRPIDEGMVLLRKLGVEVEGETLPIRMRCKGVDRESVKVFTDKTSQFLSGILLSAPSFRSASMIVIDGGAKSKIYYSRTLRALESFGVRYDSREKNGNIYLTLEGRPRAASPILEFDASQEAIFSCIPSILGGSVKITYPDGATLVHGPRGAGWTLDADPDPDLVPPLAIAAVFAPGPSIFNNVERLKFKESDRLAALAGAIEALGGKAEVRPNTTKPGALDLYIEPAARPRPTRLPVHGDHRLAMSYALAALAIDGVEIDDPACVSKSMADFFLLLAQAVG